MRNEISSVIILPKFLKRYELVLTNLFYFFIGRPIYVYINIPKMILLSNVSKYSNTSIHSITTMPLVIKIAYV